jgi:hypothetical protein
MERIYIPEYIYLILAVLRFAVVEDTYREHRLLVLERVPFLFPQPAVVFQIRACPLLALERGGPWDSGSYHVRPSFHPKWRVASLFPRTLSPTCRHQKNPNENRTPESQAQPSRSPPPPPTLLLLP